MEGQADRKASIFTIPPVQFLLGILLFLALLDSQRTLIVAAVLILGLMILTKMWSRLSPLGVTCRSTVDKDRLFPGEIFALKLRVENAKLLPVRLQASLPPAAKLEPYPEGASSIKQSGLLGYQVARLRWELHATKRGVYRVGPPRLQTGDFLGFFLSERGEPQVLDIVVYPKLIPLKPLVLPRRDFFGVPGTESPVQDPVYMLGTRDYQHNQPARHIHWKASARHGRLQEKTFEPTVQEKVLLVLEVDQFAAAGATDAFEHTLEVMASLALQLDQKGCPLGLATNGRLTGDGPSLLPVAGGPLHLSAILETLARVQMVRNGALIDVLRKGLPVTGGLSAVHFSYHQNASTPAAENYFILRKTIPLFVLYHPSESSGNKYPIQSRTCFLNELPIEGTEGE